MPSHTEGFTGDALNMLLTPPYILDQVETVKNPNEYLAAIRDGRVWDNCSAYSGKCGRSFYKVRRIFLLKPLVPRLRESHNLIPGRRVSRNLGACCLHF